MELEVLGIGNAFTACWNNTSFLIHAERPLLIDGPPGLFRILKGRGISPLEIGQVLVTHVHGDHVAGLEALLLWRKYVAGVKTRILTSPAVFHELKTCFFPSFRGNFSPDLEQVIETSFEEFVDFVALDDRQTHRIDDELQVEIRHNWHPTPTLGMKIMGPKSTVGISGDTCFRPSLLRRLKSKGALSDQRYERLAGPWLWSSDVIYHEADRVPEGLHTDEGELLVLPEAIRNKIRLIHLPDGFQDSPLTLAVEGERVPL